MPLFFLLSVLEGIAALAALFLIPSEGLSLSRLALIGAILFPLLVSIWAFIRSLDVDWRVRVTDALTARPNFSRALAFSSSLLFLTLGALLFLLRYLNPEATASYFVRARPALTYLLLLAAQASIALAIFRHGLHFDALTSHRPTFKATGFIFAFFIVIWLVIYFTRLGIAKDTSYWGEPGVPILGWQFILALLAGLLSSFIFHLSSFPSRPASVLLPVFIYLLALLLWLSVPLTSLRNSFYAPITPPYNQPFPASDAAYYDSDAQSLLMGNGFVHKIPTRPLYILFLAGLHSLLGQDYARLILGQTIVLALLPVALYFLGKQLHSRAAGVTVALLAIFRELTSLWVASDARVSNTQMLLSEFITTLVIVAYLLLVLRWFRRSGWQPDQPASTARRSDYQSDLLAFVSGGALGLQLLLRTQSAFLAPGILILAFFVFWPDWKKWVAQSFIFAAGMILAVSPWLARNYFVTGQASLDDPIQIKAVASMYSGGTPTSNFPKFEGKTPEELSAIVTDTILNRPGYVAGFVSNQFFANTIDTLLVLPIFARYDGLSAPIHLYWYEWDGHLSPANIVLFLVYLAVIALGFAAAWKRLRWASLLPLTAFIFYALFTSIARYSGWRYIFPVDWVGYFYFALGAMELVLLVAALFGKGAQVDTYTRTQVHAYTGKQAHSLPKFIFHLSSFIFLFLFVSSLPWLAETSIPQTKPICNDSIPACLAASNFEETQVAAFLSQPNARALTGRVLYPRYFARFDGLASTNPTPAFAQRDFPRMGFLLLLPDEIMQIVLPMKGSRPFPHAADAILLGCQREDFIEARVVYFPITGDTFTNGVLSDICSP
jgi:hypothetical protein